MTQKIIWWIVTLLIGVPLFLIVMARIIMVSIYVLPLLLLAALVFGVFKVLVSKAGH